MSDLLTGRRSNQLNYAPRKLTKNGKVATTDGSYAETKEQLGGILILEDPVAVGAEMVVVGEVMASCLLLS